MSTRIIWSHLRHNGSRSLPYSADLYDVRTVFPSVWSTLINKRATRGSSNLNDASSSDVNFPVPDSSERAEPCCPTGTKWKRSSCRLVGEDIVRSPGNGPMAEHLHSSEPFSTVSSHSVAAKLSLILQKSADGLPVGFGGKISRTLTRRTC